MGCALHITQDLYACTLINQHVCTLCLQQQQHASLPAISSSRATPSSAQQQRLPQPRGVPERPPSHSGQAHGGQNGPKQHDASERERRGSAHNEAAERRTLPSSDSNMYSDVGGQMAGGNANGFYKDVLRRQDEGAPALRMRQQDAQESFWRQADSQSAFL